MTTTQQSAPRAAAAEVFVARQPIYTRRTELYGYELLFRSGPANAYVAADGSQATAELITASMLTIGLDQLADGKRAFINFTRDLLLSDYFTLLPPDRTVIELLEDVEPDDEVLAACRRLKSEGYTLALDDFTSVDGYGPLLDLADIVKVDFRSVAPAKRAALAVALKQGRGRRRLRLLAEKVETREEFEQAAELGYDYFQGHFLSRPVMLSTRELPAFKLNLIQLLHAAHKPDFDFGELEAIIKRDVSLSYKMLRFANAAAHGVRQRVESVRHALVMLGQQDVVRAVSLLALAGIGSDKPQELAVQSVVRATLCESLAGAAGLADRKLDLFLLGMFSMVDAILDMPMAEVTERLPTSALVDAALLGEPGALRSMLDLVIAYEEADWPAFWELADAVGVSQADVPTLYVDAVLRADDIFAVGEQ